MEHNRKPRKNIYDGLTFKKMTRTNSGERTAFSNNVSGNLTFHMQKNEIESSSHVIYKNQVNIGKKRFSIKLGTVSY